MASRKLLRLSLFLLIAALGAACFDYGERLVIFPSGEVEAEVLYLIPDWVPAHGNLPPRSFTPDVRSLRSRYPNAEIRVGDDQKTQGFSGRFRDVSELDSPFLKHKLDWEGSGRWRFSVRIKVPPSFADAVTREAERQVQMLPFFSPERKAVMAQRAPRQFGFRFTVTFPSPPESTSGILNGNTISWKVPLAELRDKGEIELFAEGRLSFWQRIKRFFTRGLG